MDMKKLDEIEEWEAIATSNLRGRGAHGAYLASGKKSILNPKFVEVCRNESQTLNHCRLYPELLNLCLN
jgi:hypothetical protein